MKTTIKSSFETYVRASNPTAHIALEAFVAVFNEHVPPGCEPKVGRAAFTSILGSGSGKLSFKAAATTWVPPLTKSRAKRIERTALAFYRLSREEGILDGDLSVLGWDALDEDAKGWCVSLLSASIPVRANFEVQSALFRAKETIAKMLARFVSKGPRRSELADRSRILDVDGLDK